MGRQSPPHYQKNRMKKKIEEQVFEAAGQAIEQPAPQALPTVANLQPVGMPTEIAQGVTVEEMTAMYFADALREPPYKVYQLNSKGYRYYYRFIELPDGTGDVEFYPSVTTILAQTTPTPRHLIEWMSAKGVEEANRYKQERADYGTFMHAQFEDLIINRCYDLDGLFERLKAYIERKQLPADFIYYADDLKKDVLAFAQFVLDYDVRPLAVEIALVHPEKHYAGMIDLPCTMREKPAPDAERIRAIVDFKSGRKGFFEDYEIQLGLYREMWNANFPDAQIERIFNFAPKDWRKKPTYSLKEQTNSPNLAKIPALLDIAAIQDAKRSNDFQCTSGVIELDAAPDLSANVTVLSLAELVQHHRQKAAAKAAESGKSIEDNKIPTSTNKPRKNAVQNAKR